MRILLWHVHGSWTTAFVQGPHEYVVPVLPDRGPDGLGRARTWQWPASVIERTPDELAGTDVDVVVLQRPHHRGLAAAWTGRVPGVDVPCVYVEHDSPTGAAATSRHPAAGWPGCTLVHVTHFNAVMWDSGAAPTRVVEHGVVDPGHRFTGELARAAVVVNDPVRRGRTAGTDLVDHFERCVPVDRFGMRSEPLGGRDLVQAELHAEMARRRVYLHTTRWTSLGLSLIEAMHLGMPVVALATTETVEAVPPTAGIVSTRLERLEAALGAILANEQLARAMGEAGRQWALERYGLKRFVHDWDAVLEEVVAC